MSNDDQESNVAIAVLVGAMIGAGLGISPAWSYEPVLFWGELAVLGMVIFGLIGYFFGDQLIELIKEFPQLFY